MTIQPTSLDAYYATEESRLRQKEHIWEYMLASGEAWCISDLASALHIRTSSVAPRLVALREAGWIVPADRRPSRGTHIMSLHYRAVVPQRTPEGATQ